MRVPFVALLLAALGAATASAVPAPDMGEDCWFDRGGAAVNARCLERLEAFVGRWRTARDDAGRRPGVTVRGHAQDGDATSPRAAAADQALSLRRAAAVARALEGLGVPPEALALSGVGSSEPVSSAPGPQPINRVVQIRFGAPAAP